jgi:branched-chain amino acid aminotransferase
MTDDLKHGTVWLNGAFFPLSQASISPLDRGLLYGDGLFETLRGQRGKALYLNRHLRRLSQSMAALRFPAQPPLAWEQIIDGLLQRNGLETRLARIKILVTRGVSAGLGLPRDSRPTLLVTAAPYRPPTPAQYDAGWRLHAFGKGYAPPLAGHKTLNYLYFLMARQAALDAGAHEALILDFQSRPVESATASLIFEKNGRWFTPKGPYCLPGISLEVLCELFSEDGQQVHAVCATLNDLMSADRLWAINSLMGIMPVTRIDGCALRPDDSDLAGRMRQRMFQDNVSW